MRKNGLSLFVAVLLFLLPLAACGRADDKVGDRVDVSEMSLEEIITYVYDGAEANEGFTEKERIGLVNTEITEETCAWYFGAEIPFEQAVASEYEMQPPAYSLCVARIPNSEDIEAIKETVRESADPMKWVCTGVSTVRVESVGNVVLLVMADEGEAEALGDAFLSLQE